MAKQTRRSAWSTGLTRDEAEASAIIAEIDRERALAARIEFTLEPWLQMLREFGESLPPAPRRRLRTLIGQLTD